MASPSVLFLVAIASVFCMSVAQGPICGASGRRCVDGRSECINGECECLAPYIWGTDPQFMCYRRSFVAGESKNDPALTSMSNETREFFYPCRYLMTHVKQELRGRRRRVLGSCEFMVHSFNRRFKGKIGTHGFDLAARVDYDNGTSVLRSMRVYGTLSNSVPDVTVLLKNDFLPDGLWTPSVAVADFNYRDNPNNIKILTYWDAANNAQWLDFKACGLEISFTPYDIVLRRLQPDIPGLSVGVNCANQPVWYSLDRVMALAPFWQGGQNLSEIVIPGLTDESSLLDRAFRSDVTQNQPDPEPACSTVGPVLDGCTGPERIDAYESCAWMLEEPSFIKCVSKNGQNFLTLFERCMKLFCSTEGTCLQLRQDINGTCGHVSNSIVQDFIAGAACP